jgi:hypothetical protein
MEKYSSSLKKTSQLCQFADRFIIHYSNGQPSEFTSSVSHGGFDNDPATMNALLRTILGQEPQHLFTKKSLNY